MSATKNECNRRSPSIYRPEANAWISKRSSDLDYKGVFALIKIGFLQSSFYEVMWSSLHYCQSKSVVAHGKIAHSFGCSHVPEMNRITHKRALAHMRQKDAH